MTAALDELRELFWPYADEMADAGAEIFQDEVGDNGMKRDIVAKIYLAMRKIEMSQSSDE